MQADRYLGVETIDDLHCTHSGQSMDQEADVQRIAQTNSPIVEVVYDLRTKRAPFLP